MQSRLIQSLKENWLVLPKIYMRNFSNFHQSIWKSPNWDLDGILLSKVTVRIGVSTPPPQKLHPLFLAKPPSKLTNCPSPPPLLYWFFVTPSLKVGSFSEPQKHYSFSSLIPSYLLKVTKFLGKSPLFEFLVTTEKYFCL